MNLKKPAILFFGTPQFAVPALKALIDHDFAPVAVITQPDEPVGRKQVLTPPPVKVAALDFKLQVLQPKNKVELKTMLHQHPCDVGILVAYGMIMPSDFLQQPAYGFLNIHPSLLPRYRGSSPIQSAILNGDQKTGVTIIQLSAEVDAGPIIAQRELLIEPSDTAERLSDRLSNLGAEVLVETLPKFLTGNVKPAPQNNAAATMTSLIRRDDGLIDWSKSAEFIERQFRAFCPWPGVFTHWAGKRLKIANLGLLKGNFRGEMKPGQAFLAPEGGLAVMTGHGAVELLRVQLEGKTEVPGSDFLRGTHTESLPLLS